MPQLGADMTAGKLLAWRKKVGDSVKRGEIIADVETDKADIEVEVFSAGVIEKFLIQPGERVPVGTPLAIIREEGEAATPPVSPQVHAAPLRPGAAPSPVSTTQRVAAPEPVRLHISPAARRLAVEHGLDPDSIMGTGPGGRITLEDVQRTAQAKPAQPTL